MTEQESRVQTFAPADLGDLATAFSLLEAGHSVCLSSTLGESQPELPDGDSPPLLGIYSSGSTGLPRLCWRLWANLKQEARVNQRNAGWRWASPFSALSFAGVQVAVQAWAAGGGVMSLPLDFTIAAGLLVSQKVEALSCTPTFLNLLLQECGPALAQWTPAQITLGGEALRPRTAEIFREAFPGTDFRLIYASAEFGVLLKSADLDGWSEAATLEKRYPKWRVEGDELQLWVENEWKRTGDRVEVFGKRIRVIGRADSVANVAGVKIDLNKVAQLAEEIPGVTQARAFAAPSEITGQIVGLRITPEPGCYRAVLQDRLEKHLRERLPKEAWPRKWEFAPPVLGPNTKEALA